MTSYGNLIINELRLKWHYPKKLWSHTKLFLLTWFFCWLVIDSSPLLNQHSSLVCLPSSLSLAVCCEPPPLFFFFGVTSLLWKDREREREREEARRPRRPLYAHTLSERTDKQKMSKPPMMTLKKRNMGGVSKRRMMVCKAVIDQNVRFKPIIFVQRAALGLVKSQVFLQVPQADGLCYICSAAKQEKYCKRNFWKEINRTSMSDLVPPSVHGPPGTLYTTPYPEVNSVQDGKEARRWAYITY